MALSALSAPGNCASRRPGCLGLSMTPNPNLAKSVTLDSYLMSLGLSLPICVMGQ